MGRTAALILAGGEARRMGGLDKPLITVGGETILARILSRLAAHELIAISANGDPARFASYGCEILPDEPGGPRGPLAGILAGLRWAEEAGASALLTVPGDGPFVPSDLAQRLSPGPSHAASGGRRHPTAALWNLPLAAKLEAHLAALAGGPRRGFSVLGFAETIGARTVTFADDPDPFLNVNTPEDLRQAEARLAC